MDKFLCMSLILSWLFVHIQGTPMRIVGGHKAPTHYGRFHVSLQNLTRYHVCGGAVVSDQHIITAAHCVYGAEPQYIKAVVGTTNLAFGGIEYDVKSIIIHDEYNFDLRTNDIAILQITGTFDSQNVDILKMYTKKLLEGDPLTLSGFGAQEPHGGSSDQMYVLNVTVFNQEICQFAMRYNRQVFDVMFCTFTQIGQGSCHVPFCLRTGFTIDCSNVTQRYRLIIDKKRYGAKYGLVLNPGKSVAIICGTKYQVNRINFLNPKNGDIPFLFQSCVRNLGLLLDENLRFQEHGDSGGPLLKDGQLAGVVSWGIPCAVGFPDVHTRISPYWFWILKETGKSKQYGN